MNWRRSFVLWAVIALIWYSGLGIAGYMTEPDKDWIYWASSTQLLAKTAPSEWSANKPFGFGGKHHPNTTRSEDSNPINLCPKISAGILPTARRKYDLETAPNTSAQ